LNNITVFCSAVQGSATLVILVFRRYYCPLFCLNLCFNFSRDGFEKLYYAANTYCLKKKREKKKQEQLE
jgi:hypothetical protein